jgi:phosphatidylglycerophosphate synthase
MVSYTTVGMLNGLPNAISLSRLLLGLAFPLFPGEWRLSIVVIAALTDGIDGQLSRWLGAESKLGILLDPIADKVFFVMVVATLLWDGSITWLEVVLISLRDILVMAGAIGARIRDGAAAWVHMKPRWPGKVATVLQFLFIVVVLLGPTMDLTSWRSPIFIVTAFVSGASGLDYVWAYTSISRTRVHNESESHESAKPRSELG